MFALATAAVASLLLAAAYLAFADAPTLSVEAADSRGSAPTSPAVEQCASLYAGSLVGTISGSAAAEWTGFIGQEVYEADSLWPLVSGSLLAGSSYWLDRSIPFSVVAGGRRLSVRGQGLTVGEGLASVGIYLFGQDEVVPDLSEPLTRHLTVRVDRVSESVRIAQETSPFETLWEADPDLELDQSRLVREGQVGVLLRRFKLVYVNDNLVRQTLEDSWIQQDPQDRLMAYGTKVVVRDLQSPSGTVQYWRRLRVLVTSYSPSTAGQSRSSPHYGRTRTGKLAGTGMIAVDPSVIPLGTRIYVPGYGVGVAEDTGSAIVGKHIDVCYDDDELQIWHRWVDVYLLTPVPPEYSIRWVLPSWPKE